MAMPTSVKMLIEIIVVGVVAILIYMVVRWMIVGAWAHEAPSGWSYPSDCCGGSECHKTPCAMIIDHPDGSVSWTGILFNREMVKVSRDASCHVCVTHDSAAGASRIPHCIFLSPTM